MVFKPRDRRRAPPPSPCRVRRVATAERRACVIVRGMNVAVSQPAHRRSSLRDEYGIGDGVRRRVRGLKTTATVGCRSATHSCPGPREDELRDGSVPIQSRADRSSDGTPRPWAEMLARNASRFRRRVATREGSRGFQTTEPTPRPAPVPIPYSSRSDGRTSCVRHRPGHERRGIPAGPSSVVATRRNRA